MDANYSDSRSQSKSSVGSERASSPTLKEDKLLKVPPPSVCKEALRVGIEETESNFVALAHQLGWEDGTTLLLCCLTDQWVHVAHLGDSRMVIVRQNTPNCLVLTKDHKASDPIEAARVRSLGGRCEVFAVGDCCRVEPGGFAFTRSIGDPSGKPPNLPLISSEPDINSYRLTEDMKFLVLACDGVWDVVTPAECGDLLQFSRNAREACDALVDLSFRKGTTDNVSCLVIRLASSWQSPVHTPMKQTSVSSSTLNRSLMSSPVSMMSFSMQGVPPTSSSGIFSYAQPQPQPGGLAIPGVPVLMPTPHLSGYASPTNVVAYPGTALAPDPNVVLDQARVYPF